MSMAQTPYIILNYKILDSQHGRDRHIAGKIKAQNKEVWDRWSSLYLIHVMKFAAFNTNICSSC